MLVETAALHNSGNAIVERGNDGMADGPLKSRGATNHAIGYIRESQTKLTIFHKYSFYCVILSI